MTIPGVDATVALSIVAAVGDFTRFRSPEKLVSYLGLNPRVRQSGGQPATHGRITKQGRAHARGMLVEAAWVGGPRRPGRCARSIERVRARRGMQIAVVATARKLAVLCWHLITRGEDYAFARPSLTAQKLRRARAHAPACPHAAARRATPPATRSRRSAPASARSAEQAERAYRQLVADWQAKAPARKDGRGRRQWGATLKALKRGNSCAAGHQPQILRFAPGSTTPTAAA